MNCITIARALLKVNWWLQWLIRYIMVSINMPKYTWFPCSRLMNIDYHIFAANYLEDIWRSNQTIKSGINHLSNLEISCLISRLRELRIFSQPRYYETKEPPAFVCNFISNLICRNQPRSHGNLELGINWYFTSHVCMRCFYFFFVSDMYRPLTYESKAVWLVTGWRWSNLFSFSKDTMISYCYLRQWVYR